MNAEKPDTRQWFLRIAGKTIFGPVSTRGIVVWAEQGRILPGHEVSTDREEWLPADQVAELGISWYIDDGAGNLRGPLNRVAAETILKSGKAPAAAKLVHAAEADLSRVVRPAAEPRPQDAPTEKSAPDTTDALRQRIASLEADLARQKEMFAAAKQASKQCAALERERDALRLALAEAEQRALPDPDAERLREAAAAAESQRAQIEQEAKALRERLTQATGQLAAAEARRADAERALEAAHAETTRAAESQSAAESRVADAERALQEARARAAETEQAHAETAAQLRRERIEAQTAHSDLLTFSNTREAELLARIAELEKPLTAVERAAEACASDPGSALAQILAQEVEHMEDDLAQERETIASLRDWSARRQEAIQNRIHDLTRILNGETETASLRRPTAEPGARRNPADAVRLQAEMATLRATHAQKARLADEREAELNRKIRALETEDTRLRARFAEADKLARHNQELAETIRRREQELNQERKQREVERDHYATTQQALLRRIEQLEHATDERADDSAAPRNGDTRNHAAPAANRIKSPTWIRLKR